MRRLLLAALVVVAVVPAWAQEPVGCDKFKWPLDIERALLAKARPVASGETLSAPQAQAVEVALAPLVDARLPQAPQRAPKSSDSKAGFLRVAAAPNAATYRVTLSQGAWIDVIQDGREVESSAFSGAVGCSGVRKSVKFALRAVPFIIQLTGTTASRIGVVVTPD